MNAERRNQLADQLEAKADAVESGELGPEDHAGDNERWTVDLRFAARKLRANDLHDLTDAEQEEIEYSGEDVTEAERSEISTAREEAGQ